MKHLLDLIRGREAQSNVMHKLAVGPCLRSSRQVPLPTLWCCDQLNISRILPIVVSYPSLAFEPPC